MAVVERRAGGRAMTRGSEVMDGLRSPELAMAELEICWASLRKEKSWKRRSTGSSLDMH